MTNLVPRSQPQANTLAVQSMDDLTKLSQMLATSNYFADAKDAAQCGVKILAGLEMGMGAIASMAGIHIIQGKPVIGANLMAAAVKKSGKYNYKIKQHSSDICIIEFFEGKESLGESSFSIDDARASGALEGKNAHTWKKFARNMLFARAISNGVRWHCPDIFLGISAYTPDELGHEIDEEGNAIIKVDVQPVTAPLPQIKSADPKYTLRDSLMQKIKDAANKANLITQLPQLIPQWFPGKKSSKDLSDDELEDLLDFILDHQAQNS
jgi:hypothetical protein